MRICLKNKLVALAALTVCWLGLSATWTWSQPPVGIDALEQISDWPLYRLGTQAFQVSSYDRTGGDSDGIGYLYIEGSDFIIFDQAGPGCVYRLWIRDTETSDNREIRFFFDDEIIPRINTTIAELFAGLEAPFLSPVVDNANASSGGNYCYFPIPFASHLKIALRGRSEPHQILYHLYLTGTTVESFTGDEDPSVIVNQWSNPGDDPKNSAGYLIQSGSESIPPRQTQSVFSYTGTGSIEAIQLTPSPLTLSVLENLILKFAWDNAVTPQVNVSLGSFFDCSLGAVNIDGLILGLNGSDFYCYFPMPFWENAQLEIYNASVVSTINLDYQISYKTDAYDEMGGYFTARKIGLTSSIPGQSIQLGSLAGHGNLAGLSLTLTYPPGQDVIHSDLRCYLDGRSHPVMLGTDLDGDFNAGNYLTTGAFDKPVHGFPFINTGSENQLCAYRHFLGDLVPFASNVSLWMENGPDDNAEIDYSAVLYAYWKPELAIQLSDQIDVGNAASELAHNYSVQGGQTSQSHYYTYPGIADNQYFLDDGRTVFGQVNFTVDIDPDNSGVRLVRRRDASILPQSAIVFVDGDSVGLWRDADSNDYQRWGDSVYEIPATYTSGQSSLDITLSYLEGDGWTEYYHWIYSHVDPFDDLTEPAPTTNLTVEEQESGTQLRLSWDQGEDNAGISQYRIYRSSDWGVEPTDDYLIDTATLPQYLDQSLTPGTFYYYRVAAVDFAGNEGIPSDEVEARTSASYIYEGESFTSFLSSSGEGVLYQYMAPYGDYWSQQQQMLYASNDVNDFFEVQISITETDTFDIAGYFTKSSNYGNFQLEIDGNPLGNSISLYAVTTSRSPKIEFGTMYLEAGDHSILFRVTGKNSSSTNYHIGWDNLLLTSHYLLPVEPSANGDRINTFKIESAYPNPFNSQVTLQYSIPTRGIVNVTVYDLLGRKIDQLLNQSQTAGRHRLNWNAEKYSSGLYFVRVKFENHTQIQKTLLLK